MGESRERVALNSSHAHGSRRLFPDKMDRRAHDRKLGPGIEWRTAMDECIGLDASMNETAVSIRRSSKRIWRGKCPSDPKLIADLIRKRAPGLPPWGASFSAAPGRARPVSS
jgi:hypothetical protein